MIALLFALLLAPDPQSIECLRDGDEIAGQFRYVESRHPNGTNLRYGVVKTPDPVCVVFEGRESGEPFVATGRWVQVSWSDDQIGNQPFPGDLIVVTGTCFEPHTAWHLGDIVCIDVRLVSREAL